MKFADRHLKRVGSDEDWTIAEDALKAATTAAGRRIHPEPGEGTFYCPKPSSC